MTRKEIGNGLLSCWSCGSSNIKIKADEGSKKYPFYCVCEDCGEKTLGAASEEFAKKVWNRAYENSLD